MLLDSVERKYFATHDTPLGLMTSVWTDTGLYSLNWESPPSANSDSLSTSARADGDCSPAPLSDDGESGLLDDLINEYFQVGDTDFARLKIDPSGWSRFDAAVYERCREIPAGQTWTYKQLATAAGSSGASRAAGAAMSRNRILLVIPCHRVIGQSGKLHGFSAPGGIVTKQYLLDLES